jgi:RND family efflux transporter MFP subunit
MEFLPSEKRGSFSARTGAESALAIDLDHRRSAAQHRELAGGGPVGFRAGCQWETAMIVRANRSLGALARRRLPVIARALAAACVLLAMAACGKEEKAAGPVVRPVRTVTVEPRAAGETLSLTGEIQPRYQADIGFRVSGKILERPVDVGTDVKKGDLLARLDPQQYRQDLAVAKADVAAADAEVTRSQAQELRQRELLKNGYTTRVKYEQALKSLKTAQAQAEAARARQVQATENLGYTELRADENGVVTAVGADAGQVVSAGQMVVRLARPGEREAVFNVAEAAFHKPPQNPAVEVRLVSNSDIKTEGKVRYVSPQADPTTRTYTVRVSLPDAPPQMRLGANVIGSVTMSEGQVISLPSGALFEKDGKPAVWLVGADGTVALKPITVLRYTGDSFVVGSGLTKGEIVVTAGVQKLIPGEKVRLLEANAAK